MDKRKRRFVWVRFGSNIGWSLLGMYVLGLAMDDSYVGPHGLGWRILWAAVGLIVGVDGFGKARETWNELENK
jgi:hypothetical protein